MKHLLFALFCFAGITTSYGQTPARCFSRVVVVFTKANKPKRIYAKVDTASLLPCSDASWRVLLEKSINQSITYRNGAKKGTYIVAVKFIATKDGNISDVQCENDPGYGMCPAVLHAVKKYVRWTPAPKPVSGPKNSSG